jgi:hypothetical protein
MVEGRLDPHKKAHFTLQISDGIADGEVGDYTSVKCTRPSHVPPKNQLTNRSPTDNHKPAQTTPSRTTTLTSTSSSTNPYKLTLEDRKEPDKSDIFVFTGQRTVPKKSYVLLLDPATQKATLEPLGSTYTFNQQTKNGVDVSSEYAKIYPRKQLSKDASQDTSAGADDLFDDDGARDDIDAPPDADNPFDFRHFLEKEKDKQGGESEYKRTSSPDARNTPQFPAGRKQGGSSLATSSKATANAPAPAKLPPKPRKRKSPEPEVRSRPTPAASASQKKQTAAPVPAPTVRLDRRATQPSNPNSVPTKPVRKPKPAEASSKVIKSAEIVHDSDESDADADAIPHQHTQRSPSPSSSTSSPPYTSNLELEIEDPSAGASANTSARAPKALASLGLGQDIGRGASTGPISLASAANSAANSPDPYTYNDNSKHNNRNKSRHEEEAEVIDFGDIPVGGGSDDEDVDVDMDVDAEGDEDDVDVEDMDIGPPQIGQTSVNGAGAGSGVVASLDEEDAEGEEEDPLVKAMMEGLGGVSGDDESEESEEE